MFQCKLFKCQETPETGLPVTFILLLGAYALQIKVSI